MKSGTKSKYTSDKKYIGQESQQNAKSSVPLFSLGADGKILDIYTKSYGWRPIRAVNAYYLEKILGCIEKSGNKFSRAWYAIDQEIKRRESAGEIRHQVHPPVPEEAA